MPPPESARTLLRYSVGTLPEKRMANTPGISRTLPISLRISELRIVPVTPKDSSHICSVDRVSPQSAREPAFTTIKSAKRSRSKVIWVDRRARRQIFRNRRRVWVWRVQEYAFAEGQQHHAAAAESGSAVRSQGPRQHL